jgi:hypothetical protein
MTQNLISLTFSAEDLAAIHAAVRTLEEKLASLIELSMSDAASTRWATRPKRRVARR